MLQLQWKGKWQGMSTAHKHLKQTIPSLHTVSAASQVSLVRLYFYCQGWLGKKNSKKKPKQNNPATRALCKCETEIQSGCDTGWYISPQINADALTRSGSPRKRRGFQVTQFICVLLEVSCGDASLFTQLACSFFSNLMLHCTAQSKHARNAYIIIGPVKSFGRRYIFSQIGAKALQWTADKTQNREGGHRVKSWLVQQTLKGRRQAEKDFLHNFYKQGFKKQLFK